MKKSPQQIPKLMLVCMLLVINSCGSKQSLDTSVPSPQNLQIEPGQIQVLYSHESRTQKFESLFSPLEVEDTGVSFVNVVDDEHPLSRLYILGYACGGIAVGDIDGDGWDDIYCTGGPRDSVLYRQVGKLQFEDFTQSAGVSASGNWSCSAQFVDVDNDGDLDIHVCNYDEPNLLFINNGKGNFSESGAPFTGFASDGNGDGRGDVDLRQYDLNGKPNQLNADLFPISTRFNIMAFGEYTIAGEANLTPYFEANYAFLEVAANSGEGQLFPEVPALNPFNLCNPNQSQGVDCGLAMGAYLDNPSIAANIAAAYGLTPVQFRDFGIVNLYPGALGPVPTVPIVSVSGDRNLVEVEQSQVRLVTGIRGDIPSLSFGQLNDWRFDTYLSFSLSKGKSERYGVREDRLNHALGYNSSSSTPCSNDLNNSLASDVTSDCVPVNMYASSLSVSYTHLTLPTSDLV